MDADESPYYDSSNQCEFPPPPIMSKSEFNQNVLLCLQFFALGQSLERASSLPGRRGLSHGSRQVQFLLLISALAINWCCAIFYFNCKNPEFQCSVTMILIIFFFWAIMEKQKMLEPTLWRFEVSNLFFFHVFTLLRCSSRYIFFMKVPNYLHQWIISFQIWDAK